MNKIIDFVGNKIASAIYTVVNTAAVIGLAICVVFLLIGIIAFLMPETSPLGQEYSRTITVDESEKIEQALSNAVEDVKSRNFVVVGVSVVKVARKAGGGFRVKAEGIDRGTLLSK